MQKKQIVGKKRAARGAAEECPIAGPTCRVWCKQQKNGIPTTQVPCKCGKIIMHLPINKIMTIKNIN
jgi:hypothetical protein